MTKNYLHFLLFGSLIRGFFYPSVCSLSRLHKIASILYYSPLTLSVPYTRTYIDFCTHKKELAFPRSVHYSLKWTTNSSSSECWLWRQHLFDLYSTDPSHRSQLLTFWNSAKIGTGFGWNRNKTHWFPLGTSAVTWTEWSLLQPEKKYSIKSRGTSLSFTCNKLAPFKRTHSRNSGILQYLASHSSHVYQITYKKTGSYNLIQKNCMHWIA